MRPPISSIAALAAAPVRSALLGAFLAGCVVAAPPANGQTRWQTVATPSTAEQQPTPKPAEPKPTATAKPIAPPKTTGSIKPSAKAEPEVAAKPTVAINPAVGRAFDTFVSATKAAEQRAAASSPPDAPTPQPAATSPPPAVPSQPPKAAVEPPPLTTSAARQYCVNIADAAAEAKVAWQKRELQGVAQDIEKRIARLDAKIAEFQRWVTRRDEFVKKARDSVVLIYSRMRPDAAALQLVAMDEETAAAVMLRLEPKAASTILNEMEPGKAARLTAIINGAAREESDAPAKNKPEGGKS
jgi:flagellar motility protein MotE (MotC chaperone)